MLHYGGKKIGVGKRIWVATWNTVQIIVELNQDRGRVFSFQKSGRHLHYLLPLTNFYHPQSHSPTAPLHPPGITLYPVLAGSIQFTPHTSYPRIGDIPCPYSTVVFQSQFLSFTYLASFKIPHTDRSYSSDANAPPRI